MENKIEIKEFVLASGSVAKHHQPNPIQSQIMFHLPNFMPQRNHKSMDVYVLKRAHTGVCFSITSPFSNKRKMVAFTDKHKAAGFHGMIKQFQDAGRPHQKIVIERMPFEYLRNSCMYSSLDLVVYIGNGQSVNLPANINKLDPVDMAFDLEMRYKYQ